MNNAVIFLSGAVVGGLAGYGISSYVYKKKFYGQLDAVRDSYSKHFKPAVDDTKIDKPDISTQDREDYDKKLYSLSYESDSEEPEEVEEWEGDEEEGPTEPMLTPYYITPEEFFEEHNDHAKQTLTYYDENGVLVNDEEECIDIDSNIGSDFINHIGDYEEDAAFVRNEAYAIDYEVQVKHSSFNGGD